MNKRSFLKGAIVLGAAGLLVKILGAIYQLPFAAMIGADGMACYTPAYYVYTIFIVISTSGIPVAISRMVSERIIVQNFIGAHRVFRMSFVLMLGIGIVSFAIMFFGADFIASASQIPDSALAMRTIAPALIIVPVMAAYRGYFQGQQNMIPTAISQVVEQIFRVVFGLALAYMLYNSVIGLFPTHGAGEKGAAGGAFGATAGAIGGLVIMLMVFTLARKGIAKRIRRSKNIADESNFQIVKKILIIAIPITLGACIAPIMSYLDAPIIVNRLQATGWDPDVAKNLYGQISGYVTPLTNLPQALSMALSMSLVPLISSAHRIKDTNLVKKNTALAIRIAVMIGMPCAAGMAILAEPILLLLYSSHADEAMNVAPTFAIMAASVVLVSIVQTVSGILQGLGKQLIPVRNMLIGIVVKVVLTVILVSFHDLNIKGAAIATLITYIVVVVLDMKATMKYTKFKPDIVLTYIRPGIATAVMTVVAWLMYYKVLDGDPMTHNVIPCLLSILVAMAVYALMLIVTRSLEREDLESFGLGRKVLGVMNRITRRRG